jgi:ABC-type sugar transport system substrate-binding protein
MKSGNPSRRHFLMKKVRCALSCTILLEALLLSSCHKPHRIHVAVIEPTGGLQYWQVFNNRLRELHPEIEFTVQAPEDENDSPMQARMVNRALEQGTDAILLSPSHQLVLVSVVKNALERGVPVVVVGGPLDLRSADNLAFVGWNNEQLGRMAAEWIVNHLQQRGRVSIVSSSPTLQATVSRENGFLDLVRLEPEMKTTDVQYALSDWARARQAALDLMNEQGGVQGIFATDDFCTHGVIAAFDTDSRIRPVIIGVSSESDQLDALDQHKIDALIVSDPGVLAGKSVSALEMLFEQHLSPPASTVPLYVIDAKWREDTNVAFLLTEALPKPH